MGTGNPLSIIAFAAAGADSFDGLEWCRTAADYDNNYLFHFQQFDFFREHNFSRVQSQKVRAILENTEPSYYNARVASYNYDYFTDHMKTVRDMIGAGQFGPLLKFVPKIGTMLFQELNK